VVAGPLTPPPPNPADPTDYFAWVAKLMPPSTGGGADALAEAADLLDRETWYDGAITFHDPNLAREPAFAAWLDANADALARFRHAGDDPRPAGRFEPDADGGLWQAEVVDLPDYRLLARLAVGSAARLAADGQYDDAASTLADALAAGRRVGRSVVLDENHTGIAMQTLAEEGLRELLAAAPEGAIDYAALAERLSATPPDMRPAREVFAAQQARVLDGVQRVFQRDPTTGAHTLDVPHLRSWLGDDVAPEFWSRLDEVKFDETVKAVNEYYAGLVRLADEPWPQARAGLAQLEQQRKAANNPLLDVTTAGLDRSFEIRARAATERQAVALIARVKAYQQQRGRLPGSLAEVGSDAAAPDPLSGQPFVYRRAGDDFVLYSLGENAVDDRGAAGRYGQTQDWVFWPPPAN
jgi:hypothetical protein